MTAVEASTPLLSGYSALVIANRFIELAANEGKGLTQMQVQKLVFISHGYSMALLGRPLIYNTIHAWRYGPVVRKLWDNWPHYGAKPVLGPLKVGANEPLLTLDSDSDAYALTESVWKAYGAMSGEKLSQLTHQPGSPWEQVYGSGLDLIPDELVREYYTGLSRS